MSLATSSLSPRHLFGYYVASSLGLVYFFLALDLLRRFEHFFRPLPFVMIVANISSVWVAGSLWAVGLAALLWGLSWGLRSLAPHWQKHCTTPGDFILYFLFATINVLFFKLHQVTSLMGLSLTARAILLYGAGMVAALAFPWVGRRLIAQAWFVEHARSFNRFASGVWVAALAGLALCLVCQAWMGWPLGSLGGTVAASDRVPVVLLTWDSLSAHHVGTYGCVLPTTPNLDALSQESYVFERCHSNSNQTSWSLPEVQGYHMGQPRSGPCLTEALEQAGYGTLFASYFKPSLVKLPAIHRSAMFLTLGRWAPVQALYHVVHPENLLWLDLLSTDEWSYYDPYIPAVLEDYYPLYSTDHFPPDVPLDYIEHILRHARTPSFIWAHLWQPHYPYVPDAKFVGRLTRGGLPMQDRMRIAETNFEPMSGMPVLEALYDECVMSADDNLGRFVARLKEDGLYDRIILIISADHGETFHTYWGHGGTGTQEELVNIPLIVHVPGLRTAVRVKTFAQLTDLAPTILDLVHVPIPKGMQGESLVPYMEHPERLSQQPKFCISSTVYDAALGEVSIFWDRYKLTFLRQKPTSRVLFDVDKDPRMLTDVQSQHLHLADQLQRLLSF